MLEVFGCLVYGFLLGQVCGLMTILNSCYRIRNSHSRVDDFTKKLWMVKRKKLNNYRLILLKRNLQIIKGLLKTKATNELNALDHNIGN